MSACWACDVTRGIEPQAPPQRRQSRPWISRPARSVPRRDNPTTTTPRARSLAQLDRPVGLLNARVELAQLLGDRVGRRLHGGDGNRAPETDLRSSRHRLCDGGGSGKLRWTWCRHFSTSRSASACVIDRPATTACALVRLICRTRRAHSAAVASASASNACGSSAGVSPSCTFALRSRRAFTCSRRFCVSARMTRASASFMRRGYRERRPRNNPANRSTSG